MSLLKDLYSKGPLIKDSSGQLGTTTSEELQRASDGVGRSSAPTSPVEAGVLGVSPDSAKMAGTGSQKLSALRTALTEDLAAYQRRSQARGQASAAEAEKMKQASQLSMLGRIDEIANQLATQKLTGNSKLIKEAVLLPDDQLKLKLPPNADVGSTKGLLKKVAAGEQLSATELSKLITSTGLATTDERLIELMEGGQASVLQKISGFFGDPNETIASAISGAVSDKGAITLKELTSEQLGLLGFKSMTDLSQSLGLPEQLVADFSLQQLDNYLGERFGSVDELKRAMNDPNLSANDREQARQQLIALGSVGLRAAEESLDPIKQQVAASTSVSIPGIGELRVSDLVDNKQLTAAISAALKQGNLSSLPVGLREWVVNNQKEIEATIAKQGAGLDALADTAKENIRIVGGVPEKVANLLFGPKAGLSTERLVEPPLLASYKQLPITSPTRGLLDGLFNSSLVELAPEAFRAIVNLKPEQLPAYGINTADDITRLEDYYAIFGVMNSQSPEAAVKEALGGIEPETFLREWTDLYQAGQISGDSYRQAVSVLDADGDGKVDDKKAVLERVKSSFLGGSSPSLDNFRNATLPSSLKAGLDSAKTKAASNPTYQLYSSWIADGAISGDEVVSSLRDYDTQAIRSVLSTVRLPSEARNAVEAEFTRRETSYFTDKKDKLLAAVKGNENASLLDRLRAFSEGFKELKDDPGAGIGASAEAKKSIADSLQAIYDRGVNILRSQEKYNKAKEEYNKLKNAMAVPRPSAKLQEEFRKASERVKEYEKLAKEKWL